MAALLPFLIIMLRVGVVVTSIVSFVTLLTFANQYFFTALSTSLVGDLISLLQMWLPFNIDVLFAWIISGTVLLISYSLTQRALSFMSKFTSTSS